MTALNHIWWRARLVYHWRRSGMCKRRLRALPTIWKMTDDQPYHMRYVMGFSPISVATEEWQ